MSTVTNKTVQQIFKSLQTKEITWAEAWEYNEIQKAGFSDKNSDTFFKSGLHALLKFYNERGNLGVRSDATSDYVPLVTGPEPASIEGPQSRNGLKTLMSISDQMLDNVHSTKEQLLEEAEDANDVFQEFNDNHTEVNTLHLVGAVALFIFAGINLGRFVYSPGPTTTHPQHKQRELEYEEMIGFKQGHKYRTGDLKELDFKYRPESEVMERLRSKS